MKSDRIRRTVAIVTLFGAMGGASRATANIAPDPEILEFEATQEGQDVVIALDVVWDLNGSGSLKRQNQSTGEEVLLTWTAGLTFVDTYDSPYCAWVVEASFTHDEWCAENPDECIDCNQDSAAECRSCQPASQLTYRDPCVPPASYLYTVEYSGVASESVELEAANIDFDNCLLHTDTSADASPDSETDSLSEANDDSGSEETLPQDDANAAEGSGCSAVPIQSKRSLLPLLYWATGLL